MKKNKFLIYLSIVLVFISCNNEKLTFDKEKYEQKSTLSCNEECTKINIEIEIATGNIVADSINKKVFESIKNIVYFGDIPLDATTYGDLTNSFIKAYDDFKTQFPDDLMVPWEANVTAKVQYQSNDLIQIKLEHYTFTGGAHGMFAQQALNFDALTGESLDSKDLFKDIKGLKTFAANKFKNKFNIPEDQSLSDAGFFFQNEDFVLPENIFFTTQEVIFHYNVYEIASYAQGAIIIEFTKEELNPFLK
jgi:hypothetical protein